MPTNVNPAASPSIQPAARTSETKTDKISVTRDGGSASGFAKQTDVKFTNSVDNMSAILEKISSSTMGKDSTLPQQLREMINNVVTKAFSLESSLGEGLGSAMASERYSTEQLTSLGRIFQQLGNAAASAEAVTGEAAAGEATASQLSDTIQAMLSNVKALIANSSLSGKTANLELVQLTKLAFQMLNDGGTQGVSQDMQQLLQQLSGSGTNAGGTGIANQQNSTLKQLANLLFPKLAENGQNSNATGNNPINQAGMQQAMKAYGSMNNATVQGQAGGQGNLVQVNTVQPQQAGNQGAVAENNVQGQNTAQATVANGGNSASQNAQTVNNSQLTNNGSNLQNNAQPQETTLAGQKNTGLEGKAQGLVKNPADNAQAGTQEAAKNAVNNGSSQAPSAQGKISPHVLHQAAEIESNPLFKQIFSRYGFSQETGVVRNTAQAQQEAMPQLVNNQQTVDSFKNLAELLLKDSNLTAKDSQLLQNFINGKNDALSQQDAKQLNLLLKMVQSNIPAAVQQAGQQQGMDGLPKLWAFLQLAELGSLKDIKAKDYKNAQKEIKTVVSSMKGSISSEGSYQADGQKSISFVMPLYIGVDGHSYPAYINIYDEPPHEDEAKRMRKDTWFRVCVLTDNIGAVDIVCQLFEGNNLNLRVNFSSQEAVRSFGEYLPDIRKALYDTSIHLNDLRVGTVS